MPAPPSERQALERERVELPKEFAGYQAELRATPRDQTARRDRLQWEMRRVQKRMARVAARLGDLQAGRFAAK
jgi:hypothetical protein